MIRLQVLRPIMFGSFILGAGFLLGGCSLNGQSNPAKSEQVKSPQTANPGAPLQAEKKSGETRKTGTISTSQGKFFLAEPGQTPKEIESYQVTLADYVGQTVTVVGQYSGDTLFVGKIE